MINPGIDNLIGFIRENGIIDWKLSTSSNPSANNLVFDSDPGNTLDDELKRMERVLDMCEYNRLYLFGKTQSNKTIGNFGTEWNASKKGSNTEPTQQVAGVQNTMGMVSRDELEMKISEALERQSFKMEKEALQEEKKHFEEEKKQMEEYRSGVIGTLLEKSMPYLGQFFGMQPSVAGVPGNAPVMAAPVIPREVPAAEAQAPVEPVITDPTSIDPMGDAPEEEVFTDQESDELFELMARYKQFDPDYKEVLTKLIDTITSGKSIKVMGGAISLDYKQIKEVILDL